MNPSNMRNDKQSRTLTDKAYAKINLSLDIVSKMSDGYHSLQTLMQTVELCDEVSVTCMPSDKADNADMDINVDTDIPYLPENEGNIAYKAANAYFRYTEITEANVRITIKKAIPICAGLGGGSADAACVLRLLNEIFETKLGRNTLETIGKDIGADVPFCITGGTKLATGRGEILTDLLPLPKCDIVICKPPFHNSTASLFSQIKCKNIRTRPDTDGIVAAINKGDLGSVARHMYNVFEDFLPRGKDEVDEIKSTMLDYSALGTVMTGSGSAVFGIFNNPESAKNAHNALKETFEECFLTKSYN